MYTSLYPYWKNSFGRPNKRWTENVSLRPQETATPYAWREDDDDYFILLLKNFTCVIPHFHLSAEMKNNPACRVPQPLLVF